MLKITACSYYPFLDPVFAFKKYLEARIDVKVAPHPSGYLTDWLRANPESGFISDITDAALAGSEPAQMALCSCRGGFTIFPD